MADENLAKPYYTVLILAFVCSALVAGAAVGLRPLQEKNKSLDQKKHILYAANLYDPEVSIDQMFAAVETKIVDLETGDFVPETTVDPKTYKQEKAALVAETGDRLAGSEDLAKIGYRERFSFVYLIKENGKVQQIVLPVRGKGLWSTMFAYVALSADMATINGVSFYQHGETPGLGGEVENSRWQKNWQGKQIYDADSNVAVHFAKGKSTAAGEEALYQIDGLSGATLTTDGVDKLMKFWFGDHGFKPFISQMKKNVQEGGQG